MGRGRDFLERLAEQTDLYAEQITDQPIVEAAGYRRVLIENHFGIKCYTHEKIIVKVKFGSISICGCGLDIMRITKEQLVICGSIDAITFQRRG